MPSATNRPVCPAPADLESASFLDPTASLAFPANILIGKHSYIAPFVDLLTPKISIGEKTDLQDSVMLAGTGSVTLGDEVILAHGARVDGTAKIELLAVKVVPRMPDGSLGPSSPWLQAGRVYP